MDLYIYIHTRYTCVHFVKWLKNQLSGSVYELFEDLLYLDETDSACCCKRTVWFPLETKFYISTDLRHGYTGVDMSQRSGKFPVYVDHPLRVDNGGLLKYIQINYTVCSFYDVLCRCIQCTSVYYYFIGKMLSSTKLRFCSLFFSLDGCTYIYMRA